MVEIKPIKTGRHKIGPHEDLFFIAEIGINHNQDFDMAKRLVDAAAAAGCSAAKFQTFTAKALYVDKKFSGTYRLMGKDIPIYDLHVGLEMPYDWIKKLRDYCDKKKIEFFSTPVDAAGVDMLLANGVELFKVSSYDMTNVPLLRYLTQKKKPVIFSTGGARMSEVAKTAEIFQSAAIPYAVLQCIAKYPALFHHANMAVMETFRNAFSVPVGFSDNGFESKNHIIDNERVPIAAAQAGADLFEIHITLDRSLPGADHGFATTPDELKSMVQSMRKIREKVIQGKPFKIDPEIWGSSVKLATEAERYVRDFAYKCLFAKRDIAKGELLTTESVGVLRPGAHKRGLEPEYFEMIVNKGHASKNISAWAPITWEDILA